MFDKKRLFIILLLILASQACALDSQCFGDTADGYLVDGVQLPVNGKNFVSYHSIGVLLGRTYLHSQAVEIIIDAYDRLAISAPDSIYKYAETGFASGGLFKPHKTHQNGLSIDFMVPVKNKKGLSVHFPTTVFNKFGYDVDFNNLGDFKSYHIDFKAMAAHIKALDISAKQKGYGIRRVIFDPKLQAKLFDTADGDYLVKNIVFLKKRSWVRHDEHYHVDFIIPCLAQKDVE
ncbi:MAG: penicillin-insensitive murein endopeptidase [Alcanivoracaceae bacterium]|nr:penicillin-insensitive murein endopeptidase [Alcanivoracaceae bacterium]